VLYLQRRLLRGIRAQRVHLHRAAQLGTDDLGQIGAGPVAHQMALLRFEQQRPCPLPVMTELMAS
jgi:hypothetical protein